MDRRERLANRRKNRQQEQEGGGIGKYTFIDLEACEEMGITPFRIAAGKEYMLIPVAHPDDDLTYEVTPHYNIGPNGQHFACALPGTDDGYSVDHKGACPVCEKFGTIQARQRSEGVEFGDKEAWEELKPFYVNRKTKKPHHIMFVYDANVLAEKEPADVPLHYVILPESVAGPSGSIADECFDVRTRVIRLDPANPSEGRDIYIKTEDKAGYTNYVSVRLIERADAEGDIDYAKEYPELYADLPHLAEIIKGVPYADVKEALTGYRNEPEEAEKAEPDEAAPTGRRRRTATTSDDSSKPEPADDDTPKDRLAEVRAEQEEKENAGESGSGKTDDGEPVRRRRRRPAAD